MFSQSKGEVLRQRVDSALEQRYYRIRYDTLYIQRPRTRLTLKARMNVSGNAVKTFEEYDGVDFRADLETDNRATFSLGVSYSGISVALALNPAKISGRNSDKEYNINYYSNRLSFDASYQRSHSLHGTYRMGDRRVPIERGDVKMSTLNIAGYYTFNYRRFSYPAAFTQSYLQRRSAGSWLAGFSYQGATIKHDTDTLKGIPKLRTFVGNFAIGGGYGYNLVAGRHWLFHLSAMPTLIVWNSSNITVDGEKQKMGYRFPELIFNSRLAVVFNVSERYFLAATAVMNLMTYHTRHSFAAQNKWYTRASFGVRL